MLGVRKRQHNSSQPGVNRTDLAFTHGREGGFRKREHHPAYIAVPPVGMIPNLLRRGCRIRGIGASRPNKVPAQARLNMRSGTCDRSGGLPPPTNFRSTEDQNINPATAASLSSPAFILPHLTPTVAIKGPAHAFFCALPRYFSSVLNLGLVAPTITGW